MAAAKAMQPAISLLDEDAISVQNDASERNSRVFASKAVMPG
jgi:hypothetical protein